MRVQLFAFAGLILMMGLPAASQQGGGIPRTPDGRPDLTGIYDANTLTQIERPAKYGGREALTDRSLLEVEGLSSACLKPRRRGRAHA